MIAIGVLVLGAASCGGGDGKGGRAGISDTGGGPGSGHAVVDRDATLTGTDREQVRKTLEYVRAAALAGDGEGYCSKLTAKAQREEAGRRPVPSGTCPDAVRSAYELAERAGIRHKPARTVSIEIAGDRAIAMVSDGGRPRKPLRLVRVDGEWKIPDTTP